jgi:hypothetical protein
MVKTIKDSLQSMSIKNPLAQHSFTQIVGPFGHVRVSCTKASLHFHDVLTIKALWK